jgi:hypothetical protein
MKLKKFFERNKSLVLIQRFSEYLNKQTRKKESQKLNKK